MLVHSRIKNLHVKEYQFIIDPNNTDSVDTICAYLREIWRIADDTHNARIKNLAQAAFDKANRMDRGLKKYRKRFMLLPQTLQGDMINADSP